MDLKDEKPNTEHQTTALPKRPSNLVIWSCLIAITLFWGLHSFTHPEGLLHSARIRSHSYINHMFGCGSGRQYTTPGNEDICTLHDPDEDPLPPMRSQFGSIGTIVHGWPSTGGIWVHESCFAIELNFLGISRFVPSKTQRFSTEEDDFCKRLEWIGARFYKSEYAYNSHFQWSHHENPYKWWYGWPGAVPDGGVWALRVRESEEPDVGVSRIRNAVTMQERFEVIEMLGGKFYERWEDIKGMDFPGDEIDDELEEFLIEED